MAKISRGWKSNPNYKPKYSLSIKYIKKIMSKRELDNLMSKYIKAKLNHYGE